MTIKITHEFVVCPNCAMVIANSDTSGIEDPEAHLARMDATLPGGHVVVTGDTGAFRADTCGACGLHTETDQWRDAVILGEE